MPLLSTRFIQKDIEAKGNTVTITEISRSTGSGEYRDVTETETEHTGIKACVQILNESDDSVKQGEARAGDLIFYFDSDNESYLVTGNRITYDSKTYQIIEVRKYNVSDQTYLIECRTNQI